MRRLEAHPLRVTPYACVHVAGVAIVGYPGPVLDASGSMAVHPGATFTFSLHCGAGANTTCGGDMILQTHLHAGLRIIPAVIDAAWTAATATNNTTNNITSLLPPSTPTPPSAPPAPPSAPPSYRVAVDTVPVLALSGSVNWLGRLDGAGRSGEHLAALALSSGAFTPAPGTVPWLTFPKLEGSVVFRYDGQVEIVAAASIPVFDALHVADSLKFTNVSARISLKVPLFSHSLPLLAPPAAPPPLLPEILVELSGRAHIGGGQGFGAKFSGSIAIAEGVFRLQVDHEGGYSPLEGKAPFDDWFRTPAFSADLTIGEQPVEFNSLRLCMKAPFAAN